MRKLNRLFTLYQASFGALFWLPIFYEYQRGAGIADADIFAIQSFYYLAFCFLEIPTGFIADRWGHRLCLIAAGGVLIVANLLPVFWATVPGFFLHFTGLALARSLNSGASSAYLYESLKAEGRAPEYREFEGRIRSVALMVQLVSYAAAGVMMAVFRPAPYLASTLAGIVSFGAALSLPRLAALPAATQASGGAPAASPSKPGLLGPLKALFSAWRSTPLLIPTMLLGAVMFVLARVGQVNLFQPVLTLKGMPLASHGFMMSALAGAEAIASARSKWALKRLVPEGAHASRGIFWLTAGLCVAWAAVAFVPGYGAAVPFLLTAVFFGMIYPLQKQLMNDLIPDGRIRATLLSAESLIDRAIVSGVALAAGAFVAEGRVLTFVWVSGLVGLVWAIACQKMTKMLLTSR
jgi:MFS family permease